MAGFLAFVGGFNFKSIDGGCDGAVSSHAVEKGCTSVNTAAAATSGILRSTVFS
jgi:hypothetical protein